MKTKIVALLSLLICSISFSQTNPVPSKKEIYDFANQFIHGTDSTVLRLRSKTLLDTTDFLRDTTMFSTQDFEYFRVQLKEMESFKWNQREFKKVKTISSARTEWIFRNRKGWKRFKRKFHSCLVKYSMPIFNLDKTYCIMESGGQCDWLAGGGSTSLYKLEDGKWKWVKAYGMWVS